MHEYETELIGDTIVMRRPDKILAFSLIKKQGAQIEGEEMKKVKTLLTNAGFFNPTESLEVVSGYSTPKSLMLLLGRACPLKCVYCYADGGESNEMMTKSIAKKAMDSYLSLANGQDRLKINLHGGGEPTVNQAVIKYLIEEYRDERISWNLTTSGVMPSDFLDWLIEHNVGICISVDGPPDIQDIQRPLRNGAGSSAKVEVALKRLRESDRQLAIRGTFTESTIDRMDEILEYFKGMGVTYMHFEALYSIGRAVNGETTMPKAVSIEDWIKGAKYALKWSGQNNSKVKFAALDSIFIPGMMTYCGAVSGKSLVVTHDGLVTGCSEVVDSDMPESEIFHLGYLKKGGVHIDDKKAHYLSQRVPSNMASCKECFARLICRGGCLHKGWSATGDIYKPDPEHCSFVRAMVPFVLERAIQGFYS